MAAEKRNGDVLWEYPSSDSEEDCSYYKGKKYNNKLQSDSEKLWTLQLQELGKKQKREFLAKAKKQSSEGIPTYCPIFKKQGGFKPPKYLNGTIDPLYKHKKK